MTPVPELRGAVLGKAYRLGRRVGSESDEVYETTHELVPGRFILHLFAGDALTRPEGAARIQRGARLASLLRHDAVIQVLDFNVGGETPAFVVTERREGRSLSATMADEGMLPVARAAEMLAAIGGALEVAHAMGLVHGDIRPGHVLVAPVRAGGAGPPAAAPPAAMIGGFGWAKELRAVARSPEPSGYLAPEQRFGQELVIDERVDQFALGALAYEMIAACLPFSDESDELAAGADVPRTPPPLADLVPGVPRGLDDVLRRALSFAPAARYPSLGAFLGAFADAARGEAATAALPSSTSNDATEELDLATLTPLVASSDRDDLDDDDLAPAVDDEPEIPQLDDGEALALGTNARPQTDEARTQIRRSPFLDDEDLDEGRDEDREEAGELSLDDAPGAGVPTNVATRPPSGGLNDTAWEQGLSVVLEPHEPTASGSAKSGATGRRLATWRRRALAAPIWLQSIVGAAAVLLVIGIVGLATSGDDDEAPPAAKHAVAKAAGASAPETAPSQAAADASAGRSPPLAVAPIIAAVEPLPLPPPPQRPAEVAPIAPSNDRPARAAGRTPAATTATTRIPTARPVSRHPSADDETSAEGADEPSPCSVRITSKPWAHVWIDGKNTGRRTPVKALGLPCGAHKLELKRADKGIEQMEMMRLDRGTPYVGNFELE